MRRRLVVICAVLVALAGVALSGAALAAENSGGSQLHANMTAARRDAARLLASLRLPGGVTRLADEPAFAKPLIGGGSGSGRFNAGDTAWWSTAESPQEIIDYVKAHRPAGSSSMGTGSSSDGRTGTTSLEVMFNWPDTGPVYNRTLTVSVVTSANGASAIAAQSKSSWIVPRASSE